MHLCKGTMWQRVLLLYSYHRLRCNNPEIQLLRSVWTRGRAQNVSDIKTICYQNLIIYSAR
jgi:hypothetical protein